MSDLANTQGPWMVRPTVSNILNHLIIVQSETQAIIATVPPKENGEVNWADAAMLATAPHAIEALIEISTELNTSKNISIERINSVISQVFEKLHAETDVDL